MSAAGPTLLSIRGLSIGFETEGGLVQAVDRIGFDVPKGATVGLVGESGCGKSVTALSILQLLPRPSGRILAGEILFDGTDLTKLPLDAMRQYRGKRIGIVFQEPMTALNPVHSIGRQLGEVFRMHLDLSPAEIRRRSLDMLAKVGIPSPEIRLREYPHQLSGGMRQRVGIAMALACGPDLLIADEPTTALDVTIQAQILALIEDLRRETGMAVLMITHDLGVIAETCDQVVVMYAGRIAEKAGVHDLFEKPFHPYTRGLLASIPRLGAPRKTLLTTIEGMVPSLRELPPGCRFQNRCPHAEPRCGLAAPPLEAAGPDRLVGCIRWKELGDAERDMRPSAERANNRSGD